MTKIEIQKIKRTNMYFLGRREKRRRKKWSPMTKCSSNAYTRRTMRKRIWWHFQIHGERSSSTTERHCMCRLKVVDASHVLAHGDHEPTTFEYIYLIIQYKKIKIPSMNLKFKEKTTWKDENAYEPMPCFFSP